MRIPKSFGDLTIGQYQDCTLILEDESLSQLDKYTHILSVLSGLALTKIEEMDFKEIAGYMNQLGFIHKQTIPDVIYNRILAGRKLYYGTCSVDDLTAGQLISLKHFQEKGDPIHNLHDLLACIYTPAKYLMKQPYKGDFHKETSEAMKKVKLKYAYGLLFFYSLVSENSSLNILNSFQEANQAIQDLMREIDQTSQGSKGL